MQSTIVNTESKERQYPCLVVNDQTGDGHKPTVYLKPDKYTSIVVVLGYMGEQLDWVLGQVFDGRDGEIQKEYDPDEDGGMHTDLKLFQEQVELKN